MGCYHLHERLAGVIAISRDPYNGKRTDLSVDAEDDDDTPDITDDEPIIKRKRGRPPKVRTEPKTPKAKPTVVLPFPAESPKTIYDANFLCVYNGINKPITLGLYEEWRTARVAMLDAMNVLPHDRNEVSLAFKFADAKTANPTALDDATEFRALLKDLRLNLNDIASANSAAKGALKVKSKQPVTIMIVQVSQLHSVKISALTICYQMRGEYLEFPGGPKKASVAKAAANGPRSCKEAATPNAPELPQLKLRLSVVKPITLIRTDNHCDSHQCSCTVFAPSRRGDRPIHHKWTMQDIVDWAEALVSGYLCL